MGQCCAKLTSKWTFQFPENDEDCLLEMSPLGRCRMPGNTLEEGNIKRLEEAGTLRNVHCGCGLDKVEGRTNRRNFFKEVLNPRLLELGRKGQTRGRVSCIFHADKGEDNYNFASHSITLCMASDYANGNIQENEHVRAGGSGPSLDMEWDRRDCFRDSHTDSPYIPRRNHLLSPKMPYHHEPHYLRENPVLRSHCSSMSSLAWDGQADIKELGHERDVLVDEETDDLLVEIECLTTRVLRETSLWNLQNYQASECQDNCETEKYDDNHNDDNPIKTNHNYNLVK